MDHKKAPKLNVLSRPLPSAVIPVFGRRGTRRTKDRNPEGLMCLPAALKPDRGREDRLPGLPSLRTVRADFPHTALRLMVYLIEDLTANIRD